VGSGDEFSVLQKLTAATQKQKEGLMMKRKTVYTEIGLIEFPLL
jgi:hypothetical protein